MSSILDIRAPLIVSLMCMALSSYPVMASGFGCTGLEEDPLVASVEGKDGYFFRVLADIRMQHQLGEHTAKQLAEVARALEANGTTLIYVPIPTKSLTMPQYLPDRTAELGFNYEIAKVAYDETLAKLRRNGVVTVDVLKALQSNDRKHPPFLQADFHWTAWGAQAAASEVAATIKALPGADGLQNATFETKSAGRQQIISTMRRFLQASCVSSLPAAEMEAFETTEVITSGGAQLDIFGNTDEGEQVALVGTSFSDLAPANFAGFLSQQLGTSVNNYAVSGGNQFGSITAYITSLNFAEKRPRFLIWENPIYNNLGKFGDAPLRELASAAVKVCDSGASPEFSASTENVLDLELRPESLEGPSVILAYAGNENSRSAMLRVGLEDGDVIETQISRPDRAASSGRYYFPFDARSKSVKNVQITFDTLSPESANVSICHAASTKDN
ncbi:alginate biosynthesis protein [Agrobacterium rubi]|uniref:alginate O-acetyltransferase AlgX-related protein n=1 Tax=Agrobacterium rubi TaxID=28099 RepID=UPI001574B5A3|nr:alginate biosynthesis protein [Agrobacterium rubi]NTF09430.1 alginate biosynthesis protein [Agrobacterium rubi]NTF22337.1 alginate biosynthesis protein [Agrobacterium rubi]NTF29194.1 alginate biosynthesis protein [Agrobacterium rubi]